MALAAYDWLVWKDRAASFLRAHPREVALQLTWGQRLVVPGAREAYAVATYEREASLMYLFIVFCKELLCVSIPFWLKDFHLCVYIFRFCLLSQQFSFGHW